MTLTIHSTDTITEINGVPARIWEGRTEAGIEVCCVIAGVVVRDDADQTQFQHELIETPPLRKAPDAFPLRMIL